MQERETTTVLPRRESPRSNNNDEMRVAIATRAPNECRESGLFSRDARASACRMQCCPALSPRYGSVQCSASIGWHGAPLGSIRAINVHDGSRLRSRLFRVAQALANGSSPSSTTCDAASKATSGRCWPAYRSTHCGGQLASRTPGTRVYLGGV